VVGSNLPSGLDLSSMFTPLSYTPAVTATTDPGLGTGATVEGRYMLMGKLVFVHIKIVLGTSPTPGTGSYSISLPVAVGTGTGDAIPGVFFPSATATRIPVVGYATGSTITRVAMPIYTASPTYGGTWSVGGPYAIGSGGVPSLVATDVIVFSGTYLRA
jgi:hypothetical protein